MKTVLITGGSSGIGFEMSKYFAKTGYQILWVSLFEKELETAKKALKKIVPTVKIETLALDLAKADSAQKVLVWTMTNHWTVNVLVNNAGFGLYGFTNEMDLQRELDMINLNVMNTYLLTRLFLKEMIEKDAGTIINISSNSSFQPLPKMNTYASTKAFVTHFSRGLTEELKMMKSNVKVMTVCPAAIRDTNFKKVNQMEKVKTFDGLATTSTKEVGKDIWKGFQKGKDFVVIGKKMRFLYRIKWLIPYRLTQLLVRMEIKEKN